MSHRWTVIFVASTCVACSPAKDDQAENLPPTSPTTTESTTSSAPPIAGFPDLSNYNEVTSGSYPVINSPRTQGFSFSTPNGLICGNNVNPDVKYEWVGCRGPMPHEGPGVWSVDARRSQQTTVENITGDPDYAVAVKEPPSVLPPMHKLFAVGGDAVCAVDDGTTACRVGDHGFVLTPTSTKLF